MYTDLKKLFGADTPSVRQFKAKLAKFSDEEQSFYRKAALEAAFFDWGNYLFLWQIIQYKYCRQLAITGLFSALYGLT